MADVQVNTQLNAKEYAIFSLKIAYSSPYPWFNVVLGLALVVTSIISPEFYDIPYLYLTLGCFFTIGLPPFAYSVNYLNFSTLKLTENIKYTFDETGFTVNGESFTENHVWGNIKKVEEYSEFIFISQKKRFSTNLIPKKAFTEAQYSELKTLLKSIPNVRLKLQG